MHIRTIAGGREAGLEGGTLGAPPHLSQFLKTHIAFQTLSGPIFSFVLFNIESSFIFHGVQVMGCGREIKS